MRVKQMKSYVAQNEKLIELGVDSLQLTKKT